MIPLGKSNFQMSSFQAYSMLQHSILTRLYTIKYSQHLIKFYSLTRNSEFLHAPDSHDNSPFLTNVRMVTIFRRDLEVWGHKCTNSQDTILKGSTLGETFSACESVRETVYSLHHTSNDGVIILWYNGPVFFLTFGAG